MSKPTMWSQNEVWLRCGFGVYNLNLHHLPVDFRAGDHVWRTNWPCHKARTNGDNLLHQVAPPGQDALFAPFLSI